MVGNIVGYHPEVPEGFYNVRYCGYETGLSWNGKKVIVNFAISEGDYAGVPLTRYYNARNLSEPIGPNGSFDVGDRCHLVKEFRSLLPDVRSISEVNLDLYKNKLIRAQVVTVNKTGTGEDLSSSNQYSKIHKLVEIVSESFDTNSLTKLG